MNKKLKSLLDCKDLAKILDFVRDRKTLTLKSFKKLLSFFFFSKTKTKN